MRKLLLSVLLSIPMLANAALIQIDEGATIQTGSLSYDGAGGALVGTDIVFSLATGADTPVNQGSTLTCTNCLLNFTTGANTLEGPGLWQWLAGGSFSLDGDLYDGVTLLQSGNLLTGVFDAPPPPTAIGAGSSLLFVSIGSVAAAQPLVDYFGIVDNAFAFANTELALQSCNINGGTGAFACGLANADLAVTAAAVPTPATAMLFGIGAAGLVASQRKRK